MNIKTKIIAALGAGALAVTGCGSGHPAAGPPHGSSAAPAPVALTCSGVSAVLATAVHDLKVSHRHLQEAWVSGGYSGDLQNLISDTQDAVSGSNQFNTDAATFSTDASGYLADNSPYLAPGWESGDNQVTEDINAMAADCHQKQAPKGS